MPLPPASAALVTTSPAPQTGKAHQLARDLWRVTANNASAMTAQGTNSYVIGRDELCIIDPGPEDPAHLSNLLEVIANRPVKAILLTHAHRDHSDGIPALVKATTAPVWANGDARNGRSAQMVELLQRGIIREGGGTDYDFKPDFTCDDGTKIMVEGEELCVIPTPGHSSHHCCFGWRDLTFTGDHVMAWTTSVVIPPDGDMRHYIESLQRVSECALSYPVGLPGHGGVIPSMAKRANQLLSHRSKRGEMILAAITAEPVSLTEITKAAYPDIDPSRMDFAEQSCLAQVLVFVELGKVSLVKMDSKVAGEGQIGWLLLSLADGAP